MGVTFLEQILTSNLFSSSDATYITTNLLGNPDILFKVLNAIPDVIKVYKRDKSIIFFNEAACHFYDKNLEEVYNKKCYEILDYRSHCANCAFNKVLKTKNTVSGERYYPKANKYMDVCLTPIFDKSKKIIFIVERLTDVTEKKTLSNLIKRDEKMYHQIVNFYPDGIIILQDYKIVLANNEVKNLLGLSEDSKKSILYYIPQKDRKNVTKIIRSILKNKDTKIIRHYNYINHKNKKISLQFSLSYISYKGSDAIISVIRDTTEFEKSLDMATKIQSSNLQKNFPIMEKANFEYLYYPAHTVSGDYFKMFKISENLVVGILIDVSGNGVTAALNVSAFDILFLQEILKKHNPITILNNLNAKYNKYDKWFIAACCFSFDFAKKEAVIIGAGINEFIVKRKNGIVEERTVKGSFLGMFQNSIFDKQLIKFDSGDTFYFFTDGLDFVFDEDKIVQNYIKHSTMYEFKKYLDDYLNDLLIEKGKLIDDSSMLAIEIK